MSLITNVQELRNALEGLPDPNINFFGRNLIRLAPNTTFEIEKTIWIRKKVLLEGQGSVLKMVGSGPCFLIGEDYSKADAFRKPFLDSTYTTIRDLDFHGESPSNYSDIGILSHCHGLRLSNVNFYYWKIAINAEGKQTVHNSNSSSFRDLNIKLCDIAIKFDGVDSSVTTIDHCEVISCKVGIELLNVSYQMVYGYYSEATDIPIKNNNVDYTTWVACGNEGAHLTKDFLGGIVIGGNLVTGSRKVNAKGDRIGRGDSRIHFTLSRDEDPNKGVRVFIPSIFGGKGTPSPMGFVQIENQQIKPTDIRPNNVHHGIIYNEDCGRKYILGTQAWKIRDKGCIWSVE